MKYFLVNSGVTFSLKFISSPEEMWGFWERGRAFAILKSSRGRRYMDFNNLVGNFFSLLSPQRGNRKITSDDRNCSPHNPLDCSERQLWRRCVQARKIRLHFGFERIRTEKNWLIRIRLNPNQASNFWGGLIWLSGGQWV